MKQNFPITAKQFLKTTKIEVFYTLSEKFGTDVKTEHSTDANAAGFKLDRLFSIVHHN